MSREVIKSPSYSPILKAHRRRWNRTGETLYTTSEILEVLQFIPGNNGPLAIVIKPNMSVDKLPLHLLEAI